MATTKDSIKITIGSSFDAKGVQDAIKAAQSVKAAWEAAAKAMQGIGGGGRIPTPPKIPPIPNQAPQASQNERAILAQAAAQARLAQVQNTGKNAAQGLAQAEQILSGALAKVDQSSTAAIRVQTQLAQVQNQVAKGAQGAASGMSILPRTIAGLSDDAANFAQQLGTATVAFGAFKGALDLAQIGASAEAARQSFDRMAASAGTSGDALLASLQKAAGGTVAATDLIQNTNTALLLLGNDVATKLPALLEVARASAQATGQDVGYVFQSLVTGISRGSTELIDNAGIALSATEAYNTYAASIGKTADQLTKNERSQAILNGVLTAGQTIVKQSGTSADSAAVAFQQMNAAIADAKVAAGQLIAVPLVPFLKDGADALKAFNGAAQGDFSNFGDGILGLGDALAKTTSQFAILRPILDTLPTYFDNLGKSLVPLQGYFDSAAAGASNLATQAAQITGFDAILANAANAGTNFQTVLDAISGASANTASQVQFAASVTDAYAAAAQNAIPPTAEQTAQLFAAGGAFDAYAAAATNGASETQKSAELSAYDAQMKAAQTAELELAQLQAQALADAFIDANPNISASGAASAAAAAGMSPLIIKLIEATLRAREARDALAAFNAIGGIGAAFNAKGIAAANIAARTPKTGAVGGTGVGKGSTGGTGLPIGGVGGGTNTAAGTAARIAAYMGPAPKPPKAPKGRGGGGGGGAGGAASEAKKRETEAAQNAARLAKIESDLGAKLADIDTSTQEKLAAIDARAAEKRAEAARKLNEQIGADASGYNFDETLNDFDLFNSELDDKQRAALEAREAAEANYQQRVAAAGEEARKIAIEGDAEYADEYYRIKKEQAERQKQIEEAAAKATREGGDADAVAAKAAEATKANEDEAARQIAIAQAASDARKKEVDTQKQDVIDASDEQKRVAIQNANDAAEGLKTAAKIGTDAVVQGYKDQMEAANKAKKAAEDLAKVMKDLPAPPVAETTPGTETGGTTGQGATTSAAASGGQGIRAQGLSGKAKGAGSGGGGDTAAMIGTLADALQIIVWLSDNARKNEWNRANDLPNFIKRLELATKSVQAITDLSAITSKPISPIDPKAVEAMVTDMVNAVTILGTQATPELNRLAQRVSIMSNAAQLTAELLGKMAEFRKTAFGADGKLAAPIPAQYIVDMVAEANFAVQELSKAFARDTYGADFRKNLGEWVDGAEGAISLINSAADLSRNLKEPVPPIAPGKLEQLADTTLRAVQVVTARLQPVTDEEVARLAAWTESADAAVSLLSGVAGLDADLKDVDGTVFWSTLNNLADGARDALAVVQARLQPYTDEQVTALQRWTESAGAAIDVLSSAAGLIADLKDTSASDYLPLSLLQRLASLSVDALGVVQGVMLPTTEEQASALERWASSSGAAISTLSAVASLYGDVKDLNATGLSVDLLLRFAEDARKAVTVTEGTLIPYTEEQAAAFAHWGDVTQASTGAFEAVLSLRKNAAEAAGAPSLTEAQLKTVAADTTRVVRAVEGTLIPITDEQADAYTNWGSAVEASVGAASAVFGLNANMFADYQSPTDAQLNLIATDAYRVVRVIDAAARTFDTAGLEAAQQFGDAYGSIVGAFTDGLQFNAALASGDFVLDTARLATFVDGARQMISATATLGAEAIGIPPAQIAALNSTSAALTGFADAALKMNAVPLNVPQFAGGGGGSSTAITFAPGSIVVQAAPGMNADQVANLAVTKIEAKMRGYR